MTSQDQVSRLRADIVTREARRLEILDWLQDQIGTSWQCDHCGYDTYHAFNKECADCGADFPLLNLLAFKLHASHTEDEEYITQAAEGLGDFSLLGTSAALPTLHREAEA